MIKNYYLTALLSLSLSVSYGQDKSADNLGFYPNPVTNGKIFITSKSNNVKDVTIFDVLGKRVFHAQSTAKELNIGVLSPGVYIIKLEDGILSSTRKLIVR